MTPREVAYRRYCDHLDTEAFINQEPAAVKKAAELKRAVEDAEYSTLSNRQKMHYEIEKLIEEEGEKP